MKHFRYSLALCLPLTSIACGEDTATPAIEQVAEIVLSLTAGNDTLEIGDSATISATLLTEVGNTITGRTISWESTNSSVVTVADGRVGAMDAGSATITASVSQVSAGMNFVVLDTAGVPVDTSVWIEQSFEQYGTTAELMSDCSTWSCFEDLPDGGDTPEGSHALDTSVFFPGYTRSMRYDFLHPGDGCTTVSVSRQLPLPELRTEIWLEFAIRWSPNFRTTNNACPPNDHKLVFGNTSAGNTGRWGFYVGGDTGPLHSVKVQHAAFPNVGEVQVPGITASTLWDGEWHIVRLHLKHSTPANTGNNGALELWIDGTKYWEQTGIATGTQDGTQDFIRAITLGRNMDDGPPDESMSLWWGYLKVWKDDPGW